METQYPIHHSAAPDAERGLSAADDVHLDEEAYIRLQAQQAKDAMSATLHEMTEKLKNVGDVRVWTKHYPWIATGLAVGAGFVAAVTLVPTSKQEAMKTWESIKSTFTPSHEGDGSNHHHGRFPDAPPGRHEGAKNKGSGWVSTLIQELIKIIRPLLLGFLTRGFGGRGEDADASAPPTGDSPKS